MKLQTLQLPPYFKEKYAKFETLTPIQQKTVNAGLLDGESQLVCAPTASGKTLVATMAITNKLSDGKALYLVPLKALANEKYKEYRELFEGTQYKVGLAVGDVDREPGSLFQNDVIVLTTEKLDALLRHDAAWLSQVKVVVIDEIHLINDPSRGPTLEIIITLLKMLSSLQLIGLSATIGNPNELASWLGATLVQDSWRPVELKQGTYTNDELEFY